MSALFSGPVHACLPSTTSNTVWTCRGCHVDSTAVLFDFLFRTVLLDDPWVRAVIATPLISSFPCEGVARMPVLQTYQTSSGAWRDDCPGEGGNPRHLCQSHGYADGTDPEPGHLWKPISPLAIVEPKEETPW